MTAMRRMMAPMMGRIQMMLGRAVIAAVNDGLKVQGVQVELLDGEVHDDVERFQEYGYTSVPLAGAEALVAFIGGLRSRGIVIGVEDRRYRLTGLQPGEVAIYDDLGQKVHLTRDGIVIETPLALTVQAESVVVESDSIDLGGTGGEAVARVGDTVNLGTGVIETGSAMVRAA